MTRSPLNALGSFDAFIFDCDGTLAHTAPAHFHALRTALAACGHDLAEPWYRERVGLSLVQLLEEFGRLHGATLPAEQIAPSAAEAFKEAVAAVREVAAVTAIVREHAGRTPMAVASSAGRPFVMATLEAIGLASLLSAVVTVEDIDRPKPAPDVFLEAARRLAVAPERCLVFEDSEQGLEAARRANMQAVDVRSLYDVLP